MNILAFITAHVTLIGWPAFLGFCWKVSRYFSKFEERVTKAESTIELLATNHLPHLEQGIKNVENAVNDGFSNLATQLLYLSGKTNPVFDAGKRDK